MYVRELKECRLNYRRPILSSFAQWLIKVFSIPVVEQVEIVILALCTLEPGEGPPQGADLYRDQYANEWLVYTVEKEHNPNMYTIKAVCLTKAPDQIEPKQLIHYCSTLTEKKT